MKNIYKLITIATIFAIIPLFTFGEAILAPGDFIIAIDTNLAMQSRSRTPDSGNEDVGNIQLYGKS